MSVIPLPPTDVAGETDAHPNLEVRRVRFVWDGVEVSWLPSDRIAGQVVNVIHLALPPGERWFVDTYRRALPLVADERLRREMKAFMGQEAVHARSHAGFVEHMDAAGYETAPLVAMIDDIVARWSRLGRRVLGEARTLRMELAVIAGIEHYTAVLGEWALRTDLLDAADPRLADVLRWHGAEELEHKCVAFDVHLAVSGSYVGRVLGYAIASAELARFWDRATGHLVARDPHLSSRRYRLAVLRSFLRGTLPGRELVRSLLGYLRPGFHPAERSTLGLTRANLASSPAVADLVERSA